MAGWWASKPKGGRLGEGYYSPLPSDVLVSHSISAFLRQQEAAAEGDPVAGCIGNQVNAALRKSRLH
jgi:hypothetical protein